MLARRKLWLRRVIFPLEKKTNWGKLPAHQNGWKARHSLLEKDLDVRQRKIKQSKKGLDLVSTSLIPICPPPCHTATPFHPPLAHYTSYTTLLWFWISSTLSPQVVSVLISLIPGFNYITEVMAAVLGVVLKTFL